MGRLGIAREILDFIKGVLHIRFQQGARCDMLLAERISGKNCQHGLHTEILAPSHELKQSESVRWNGTSSIRDVRAEFQRPPGLLPVVAIGKVVPLDKVSPGKRRNFGWRAANFSIRSGLLPLGRFL